MEITVNVKRLITAALSALIILSLTSCSQKAETQPEDKATAEVTHAATDAAKPTGEAKVGYYKDKNGFLCYEDEKHRSEPGIDVSSYSGEIDWSAVYKAGVKNAVIRLGGRGYGDSGALYSDDNALENIDNAQLNKIKVGGYFYSQATSEEEAEEEADYVLSLLDGRKLDLPIAYDFEYIEDDEARTDSVEPAQVQSFAEAFCKKLSKSGCKACVYGYSEDYGTKYDKETLRYSSGIWLADYESKPEIDDSIKIFQYSKDGRIDGIEGSVDLDLFITDK